MKRVPVISRVLTFVMLIACGQKPETGISPKSDQVWVKITNYNWSDVNVYAIDAQSGQRSRIESNLPFNGTRKIKLPYSFYSNSEVFFQIHPMGGRSQDVCYMPTVHFFRGATIELEIKNYIPSSSCSLEPRSEQ